MRRFALRGGVAAKVAASVTMLALAGCGDGTPSVSSSSTEVTVRGSVRYKGLPVKKGTIQFNPANIRRRDAKAVGAPIGADGSYTIRTLEGENTVTFVLPGLSKKDFGVASASFVYDAPTGESSYDVELVQR